MRANVTAISNLKGGVGKSTTTVMLAEGLAYYYGADVLVIDLDPQANSSQMFLTERGLQMAFEQGKGTHHLLGQYINQEEASLADLILPNAVTLSALKEAEEKDKRLGWVSIIPSHPQIRMKEMALEETAYSGSMTPSLLTDALANHIQEGIAPLVPFFDYILFDTPPYLSPLARAALKVSGTYLTPTLADSVSTWGTKQFSDWVIQNVVEDLASRSFIVVTRFKNTRYARNAEQELKQIYLADRTFGPTIPESVQALTAMERASMDSYYTFKNRYGNLSRDVKRLAESFSEFVAARTGKPKPQQVRS